MERPRPYRDVARAAPAGLCSAAMATRSRRRRAAVLAYVLALITAPLLARGEPQAAGDASGPTTTDPKPLTPAELHAQKADALYRNGNYGEAIAELDKALALDPTAKILVHNLGVVHERAGDIDLALRYFRDYSKLELSPEEREKNQRDLRRLEGAKRELDDRRERERVVPGVPETKVAAPPNGRIDALTITSAAVAGAGLVWGTLWGIKATSDKPASGFVTGKNGTFTDLSNEVTKAHREAIFADIGFGVAIAGGVAAALLFALRPKDVPASPTGDKPSISAIPLRSGGALVFHGTF